MRAGGVESAARAGDHELEAWIAKQTLDCTGWKKKHAQTAPPPFPRKTMFGVVLCCIQFDSSLRALRNKSLHQHLSGLYPSTPARTHQHQHRPAPRSPTNPLAHTPKSAKRKGSAGHTPKGSAPRFSYRQTPAHAA